MFQKNIFLMHTHYTEFLPLLLLPRLKILALMLFKKSGAIIPAKAGITNRERNEQFSKLGTLSLYSVRHQKNGAFLPESPNFHYT
jgi:hypothetical protein